MTAPVLPELAPGTDPVAQADARPGRSGGRRPGRAASVPAGVLRIGPGSGLGLGLVTLYLSILVLLPLLAVIITSGQDGVQGFLGALSTPAVRSAIVLTVASAAGATLINVVFGTLVAWVLVRDRFAGRRLLGLVIDVPFALPTIVAGLVLIALYGVDSPIGITLAQTRAAIFVALLFVTLPFVVRAVQPVLEELDPDVEQAGASLGAGRLAVFRRLVLPNLSSAIAAGAALSFARSLGEYGSVTLISGSLPNHTEVASARMLSQIENDDLAGASAVATVLLVIALLVIVALNVVQRRVARRG